jgi:5-methylcytosine-specific restriction protein A
MPKAAPKPCVRCNTLVRDGSNRCDAHKVREGTFSDRRRGTRHQRGYGAAWDKKRQGVLARDGGLCQPCRRADRVTVGNIVDHTVPKAAGGSDDEENLQTICPDCHTEKTNIEKRGGIAAWPLVPTR